MTVVATVSVGVTAVAMQPGAAMAPIAAMVLAGVIRPAVTAMAVATARKAVMVPTAARVTAVATAVAMLPVVAPVRQSCRSVRRRVRPPLAALAMRMKAVGPKRQTAANPAEQTGVRRHQLQ